MTLMYYEKKQNKTEQMFKLKRVQNYTNEV
jgi:hypothetical protein